jgi:hypothetical protein
MDEQASDTKAPEQLRQQLRDVRRGMLHLHKGLLDAERAAYEQANGQVTSGQMLQLVINHEQFAWLHAISELIVRIDELFDADEPLTTAEAQSLLAQVRALLQPSEEGSGFQRKYYDALQRDPDTVLAHRDVTKSLATLA